MDHMKLVTGRRLERLVTMVVAASSSASAPEMAQAAVLMAGGPPSSGGLSREASVRWVIWCGKQGRRLGFDF
jgi:hypothetical protein